MTTPNATPMPSLTDQQTTRIVNAIHAISACAGSRARAKEFNGWDAFDTLGVFIVDINRLNQWNVTTANDWANPPKLQTVMALIHSEISEALEGFRHRDDTNFPEEIADTAIRVFDVLSGLEFPIGNCLRDITGTIDIRPYAKLNFEDAYGIPPFLNDLHDLVSDASHLIKMGSRENFSYALLRTFVLSAVAMARLNYDFADEIVSKCEKNKLRGIRHGNKVV